MSRQTPRCARSASVSRGRAESCWKWSAGQNRTQGAAGTARTPRRQHERARPFHVSRPVLAALPLVQGAVPPARRGAGGWRRRRFPRTESSWRPPSGSIGSGTSRRKRNLPPFHRETFSRWFDQRKAASFTPRGRVALFRDLLCRVQRPADGQGGGRGAREERDRRVRAGRAVLRHAVPGRRRHDGSQASHRGQREKPGARGLRREGDRRPRPDVLKRRASSPPRTSCPLRFPRAVQAFRDSPVFLVVDHPVSRTRVRGRNPRCSRTSSLSRRA